MPANSNDLENNIIVSTGSNTLASNEHQLEDFLLEMCSSLLEQTSSTTEGQAGLTEQQKNQARDDYLLNLKIALRHQKSLQNQQWTTLVHSLNSTAPLTWEMLNDEQGVPYQTLHTMASNIIQEVKQAANDNWAVKLIKTSYLSQLEQARVHGLDAIKVLCTHFGNQDGENSSHMSGLNTGTNDYVHLLYAQRDYIDSLSRFPMLLDELLTRVMNNQGVNYQPLQTTEMLARSLDILSQASENQWGANSQQIIAALKTAVRVAMPTLPVDGQLLGYITDALQPLLIDLLTKNTVLEQHKAVVFPSDSPAQSEARKALLKTMGVEFPSVAELIEVTILTPVAEGKRLAQKLSNAGIAAYDAIATDNPVDKMVNITNVVAALDGMVSECSQHSELMPDWINRCEFYYQTVTSPARWLIDGLSAASRGLLNATDQFFPAGTSDPLTKVDATITPKQDYLSYSYQDNEVTAQVTISSEQFTCYLAFYRLQDAAGLSDIDAPKFYQAFYDTYRRDFPGALPDKPLAYSHFQLLCMQKIANFDAESQKEGTVSERLQHLSEGFDNIANNKKEENENNCDTSEPLSARLRHLVERWDALIASFDVSAPDTVINEILAVKRFISQRNEDMTASAEEKSVLSAFETQYITPAIHSLWAQYREKNLIPQLEEILDSTDARVTSVMKSDIRPLYTKCRGAILWDSMDCLIFNRRMNDLGQPVLSDAMNRLAEAVSAPSIEQSPTQAIHVYKTPSEQLSRQLVDASNAITPAVKMLIEGLEAHLKTQYDQCLAIAALGSNKTLVDAKIAYINALRNLLLSYDTNKDTLNTFLSELPSGEAFNTLYNNAKQEMAPSFANTKRIVEMAWALAPDNQYPDLTPEKLTLVLADKLGANSFADVIKTQAAFDEAQTTELSPALVPLLSDPLATAMLPAMETVCDAILEPLLQQATNSTVAWGGRTLFSWVEQWSYESLLEILPYPFMAKLALQTLNSESVQVQLAPLLAPLRHRVGELQNNVSDSLKQGIKQAIYPMLGVQLQQSMQAYALKFAQALASPQDALLLSNDDIDAFAFYFLQYRELYTEPKNENALASLLFPALNMDQRAMISGQFNSLLENNFKQQPADNSFASMQALFTQLREAVDFKDSPKARLSLALCERLLLMSIDKSDELSPQDKDDWQAEIISQASSNLSGIKQKVEKYREDLSKKKELLTAEIKTIERADTPTYRTLIEGLRTAQKDRGDTAKLITESQEEYRQIPSEIESADEFIELGDNLSESTVISNTNAQKRDEQRQALERKLITLAQRYTDLDNQCRIWAEAVACVKHYLNSDCSDTTETALRRAVKAVKPYLDSQNTSQESTLSNDLIEELKAKAPALINNKCALANIEEQLQQESLVSMQKSTVAVERLALDRLAQKMNPLESWLEQDIDDHQAQLDAHKISPRLGLSVGEWEFNNTTDQRKLYQLGSLVKDVALSLITWSAIITPVVVGGGGLQVALTALGWAGAVGSAATGVGLAIFAGVAVLALGINFGRELFGHAAEFKDINKKTEPSLLKRMAKRSWVVAKCAGLAVGRTLLTDLIMAPLRRKAAKLTLWNRIKKIPGQFKRFPSEQKMKAEQESLQAMKNALQVLQKLLAEQKTFLDSNNGENVQDHSERIEAQIIELQTQMNTLKGTLKLTNNDARTLPEDAVDDPSVGRLDLLKSLKSMQQCLADECKRYTALSTAIGLRSGAGEPAANNEAPGLNEELADNSLSGCNHQADTLLEQQPGEQRSNEFKPLNQYRELLKAQQNKKNDYDGRYWVSRLVVHSAPETPKYNLDESFLFLSSSLLESVPPVVHKTEQSITIIEDYGQGTTQQTHQDGSGDEKSNQSIVNVPVAATLVQSMSNSGIINPSIEGANQTSNNSDTPDNSSYCSIM